MFPTVPKALQVGPTNPVGPCLFSVIFGAPGPFTCPFLGKLPGPLLRRCGPSQQTPQSRGSQRPLRSPGRKVSPSFQMRSAEQLTVITRMTNQKSLIVFVADRQPYFFL